MSTRIGGVAFAISEDMMSDHQGEIKINDLPIFQLLKAFKLQQYALVSARIDNELIEIGGAWIWRRDL